MKKGSRASIEQIVESSLPQPLSIKERPPLLDDHVNHLYSLVQWGQTTLASDHLLFPEINGRLYETVGGFIRRLNLLFFNSRPVPDEPIETFQQKVYLRQYSYEFMLETALNFYGLESRWLNDKEKADSLDCILNTLQEWENRERVEGGSSIAEAVISKWLTKMKRVQKGSSMAAKAALRIEEGIDFKKNLFTQFLLKAEKEIKENVYYRMVKEGFCKFGNDYAIGLRWLRHLGFEQVSTNPVLAARAYQDEPFLTTLFLDQIKRHPDFKRWSAKPSQYGDEITLYATLLALWDNLHVFRPIFFNLRETSGGGVVSFQLNPNIAHLVDESIRDVFTAFSLASDNLDLYDQYLLAGYQMDGWKGRPNLVIKVAATTPAARVITRTINSFGFGSNITVDYSVSQEATLILEEMDGMAEAVKKGIQPTQLYMTNMGGRLESHLREVKLEEFFKELKTKIGEKKAIQKIENLSETNGTKEKVSAAKGYEEKVLAATRFAHGQKTLNDPIFNALGEVASKELLQKWEDGIGKSGTLVARRVWSLFFSDENRKKWIAYLMNRKGVTQSQARLIMDRIHYLPASKRKPFDTYWTLTSRNLVHTEFPDHQENVRKMAETPQFDLKGFEESISGSFSKEVLDLLNQMEDFRKAYAINAELAEVFKEAGISGEFGFGGLTPSDWPKFGPVQKTLSEFKGAYDGFQKEMVSLIKKDRTTKKKP
ncbi:MAG: hypothetical protein FJ110_14415 [Deltaproteobacteria bacterium]|nr:hypothetical protein [Deltaproteobacteria bacterium]